THALGTITLLATPATLSGHVASSAGGAAIAGATVTATVPGSPQAAALDGAGSTAPIAARRARTFQPAASSFTATTDASGNFTLPLPPGTYSVAVTATGFGSRTTSAVNLGPG